MKIGVITPKATDATSFYRCVGPLSAMRKHGVEFEILKEVDWSVLLNLDVLFVQRPHTPQHTQTIAMAKGVCVPVWVDYDDDLTDVPPWNPSATDLKARLYHVQYGLAHADLVTVSTPAIYNKYKWFNPNTHVIHNALDFARLGSPLERPPLREQPIIFWRGSKTHSGDLATIADQVVAFAHSRPDVLWCFMGDLPEFLDRMPTGVAKCADTVDVFTYFHTLRALAPDVMIVPLANHPFNHCKSNIAYLEGAWSGATTIAPSLPEWVGHEGCLNYDTPDDFTTTLEKAITSVNPLTGDYIQREFNLKSTARTRTQLLERIICCRHT